MAFASIAGAQTITGKVSDAAGLAPLAGVRIHVVGTATGTQTRNDGTYRLPATPGTYVLRVSYIGYVPHTDTVVVGANGATRDFALQKGGVQLDAAVVTGTRTLDRTVASSPVPIDVLSHTELTGTGRVETAQMLQAAAPSINFPRPTIADGSDHVRPLTLRGLGPDQSLILINGKRRHTSALVNINGTIGRGSTGVDLNAIPSEAIDRIEILRDGAAAQYGSDAIAGVINIILKSDETTDATVQLGSNYTINERLNTDDRLTDGDLATVAANTGGVLSNSGFFHVTGQYNHRGSTNRSLPDARTQYFAGDPRNTDPLFNAQDHFRSGDALVNEYGGFLNGALPTMMNGMQIYGFAGVTRREGESAANWRLPNGNNTVRALFPNGFLPFILSTINDAAGTLGVRGLAAGWNWDASGSYGRNTFDYNLRNTNNATLGAASPTTFYAGMLKADQAVFNLDLVRPFSFDMFGGPLNVAVGGEVRRDGFAMGAGDEASYKDGGVKILDGPSKGNQPAPGAQGFPGYRPSDASDNKRTSYGLYADLEANVLENLLVGIAGRAENYADFGGTQNAKISARYGITSWLALRGALQNGFRAPSLSQKYFSATATNFLNFGQGLVPVEVRTLPVESGPAKALGAQPLIPETSVNRSLGLVLTPMPAASLTVDYYKITIDDRIIFSGNFSGAALTSFLATQGFPGVGSARYFTNAIDTRTRGVDIVGRYARDMGDIGISRFTVGYNQTRSFVTRVANTPPALASQQSVLFDRVERGRIEVGQPHNNLSMTLDHTAKNLSGNIHVQRYGEVGFRGLIANSSFDQTFSPKWISDVSLSYSLPRYARITIGADNVFDIYPDLQIPGNANAGIFPYNGISPFGFNGRFVYVRAKLQR
ncbi:MAG: TonB-dependent receptor [Gemmatimonadaceae bacterium]|nr:TonB-dependent receptor [Gemmatimonadaceae bacterium]